MAVERDWGEKTDGPAPMGPVSAGPRDERSRGW